MSPKISKAESPTPATTKTTVTPVVPRIPQEIIDEILDHVGTDSDLKSLRACSLVSKSWVPSCRRYLFYTVFFTPIKMAKWLKAFPVPEQSPTHHIKDLRFSLGGYYGPVGKFFADYSPWFTNVEKMDLLGYGGLSPSWMPPFGMLPQSVTSLTINAYYVTLVEIRDIMMQLSNLDNLSLSGPLAAVDRNTLLGVGTSLRGRFGGRLVLADGHANADVTNMLMDVPTGLHFTEVQIRATRQCHLSTVRLVEACGKTLVKLTYEISTHGKSHPCS